MTTELNFPVCPKYTIFQLANDIVVLVQMYKGKELGAFFDHDWANGLLTLATSSVAE